MSYFSEQASKLRSFASKIYLCPRVKPDAGAGARDGQGETSPCLPR